MSFFAASERPYESYLREGEALQADGDCAVAEEEAAEAASIVERFCDRDLLVLGAHA